jgi:hypothetical protein
MSTTTALLVQALDHATAMGLDQRTLALRSGLSQETISRAKKRGTMDSSTLEKILGSVGLELALRPRVDLQTRPALRDPVRGLAWSNPQVSDEVLINKALLGGGFTVILQAAVEFGLPRIQAQWRALLAGQEAPGVRTRELVNEILDNIEQGFEHAAA